MATVAASKSYGGVKFSDHRLQGKSLGILQKLRLHRQKLLTQLHPTSTSVALPFPSAPENSAGGGKMSSLTSPPPAPKAVKRRQFLAVIEGAAKRISPFSPPPAPVAANRRSFLAMIEEAAKRISPFSPAPVPVAAQRRPLMALIEEAAKMFSPISPPPAPVAAKRRTLLALIAAEEAAAAENGWARRRLVKKLGDDFDVLALGCERGR